MPLSIVSDPVLSVRLTSYTSGEIGLSGIWRQIARPVSVFCSL